jgi:hypothetical protein
VSPLCTAVPHDAQKRAPRGSGALQLAQLAGCADTLPPFPTRLKRTPRLRDPAAERPDERAVVLVGELPRAVIELELAQRILRAVALLDQREASQLEIVRLGEAVDRRVGLAEERRCHVDNDGEREQRSKQEPGGHAGASA